MRAPNISLYGTTRYQLNSITNNLKNANEVISTQKRINAASDDPIGMSQVLGLRLTIGNLDQLDKNVNMGISWLDGVETALDSISDQILDAKVLATQLVNASVSSSERADAVETVSGMIDQILALGNTQVNGSYVFSGTMTNISSFTYDNDSAPTSVVYNGNSTAFSIKTSQTATLAVGRCGESVVTETEITVDVTNNEIVFVEDPGMGENYKIPLKTSIPDGSYTPEDLAIAVRNAMNQVSSDEGYGVTYEVTYDEASQQFSFTTDGTYDGYMGFDMLWESGDEPMIGKVNTEGILKEEADIHVINDSTLIYDTQEPAGEGPIRFTWDSDESQWRVMNDPGYSLPVNVSGSDTYFELDMDEDGVVDLTVSLESAAADGDYIEFDIISASDDCSIGPDMGFSEDASYEPIVSSSEVTLKSFDDTNNVIDFLEDAGAGPSLPLSAAIPPGDYSDMDELATAIETAMESASVNNVDYDVAYDEVNRKFTIADNSSALMDLSLLWNTGINAGLSAASELGYDNTIDDTLSTSYTSDNSINLFTITAGENDYINFKEILPGSSDESTTELTARIPAGDYEDPDDLARAIEDALEDASEQNGNRVDYDVFYDDISHKFTIQEDGETGRKLESFELLWETGSNADSSAASVLGFDETDVASSPVRGEEVTWGLFETLFALKEYLANDDVDGISRTMTRLDNHYNSIISLLSDTGIKYNRLEMRQQVSAEAKLSMEERKSNIEDADIIESVMDLTAIQTAYEASLSSTSKIISLSLVDYM